MFVQRSTCAKNFMSLPLVLPLLITSFARDAANWHVVTTERFRIDMHTLRMLDTLARVPGLHLPQQLTSLETRSRRWIEDNLLNRQSNARLRLTRHLRERLLTYRDRVARNGQFIELYDDEVQLALHLPDRMKRDCHYELVEIGLNRYGNVCKLGLILPLRPFLPQSEHRKLFLLVGCDGGLKSLYTVQGCKYRTRYRVQDETVDPLDIAQLVARSV